jgi:hypothetical protein
VCSAGASTTGARCRRSCWCIMLAACSVARTSSVLACELCRTEHKWLLRGIERSCGLTRVGAWGTGIRKHGRRTARVVHTFLDVHMFWRLCFRVALLQHCLLLVIALACYAELPADGATLNAPQGKRLRMRPWCTSRARHAAVKRHAAVQAGSLRIMGRNERGVRFTTVGLTRAGGSWKG